ncbi:MAG: MOSC domain-containing protein [Proteobacteria bacterium]|nr:MOSC domain-containing protein [Pseudomonadota bacterium]MBU1717226.1 MOSC domain-containing protein [Pseudomonadota bacterium]
MGHVEAVCTSQKKGIVKRAQSEVLCKKDWGIAGDAHAGDWHRQISLLAGESIDNVKKTLPTLKDGAFAENIITRGVALSALKIGDRLKLGSEVVIEITQIGKECHNSGCAIKKATGDCIMPKEGLFSKVIKGGVIKTKDEISLFNKTKMPIS